MAQTIKLKRSATSGATPTTSQLELGEVAINTYDGKMYIKKNVGGTESIVEITGGSGGSSTLGGLSDVTISSVSADQLLQYNGSEWVNVSIAEASAIMKEYQFTATAGQSTFSGSDDNSETLSYTAGAIQVFLNGIFLDSAVDYTATNGTSVVLSETVDANDYLQVVAFKKKIGDGNVSVNTFTGDNSTTAFTLSIDPGDENNTRVFIDGVYQSKDNYSVSGTTLTFSTAPPTSTAIEVEIGNRVVTLDTLSDLDLPDDVKLRLGTSQDLQIYHDGSHSYIDDAGTGGLYLRSDNFRVLKGDGSERMIQADDDGAVLLYYDGSAKIQTSNDGVTVTGDVEADEFIGDVRGAVLFKAQAGETLAKGEVVYISGISGNTTIVSKADADDASKMPAFGLVAVAASSGNPVDIYTNGILSDIDTSAYSEGDELFVSTTAGALTATAPTGESAALQKIGKVTRSNATSGSIFIVGAGRSNAVPNLDDGDIFIGNSSNQAVSASLNTKIESYLDGGTSTPSLASLAVDSITIDGTEIDSSSSLLLDIAGNLTVNVDGTTVTLADDAINFGQFYNNASGQFNIYAPTQDKDIVFLGNDGGSTVTALTLDMSASGAAIFNDQITLGGNLIHAGNLTIDAGGDITLDAAGNDVILKDNGTTFGQLTNDSGNLIIYNSGSQMLKGLGTGSNAQFMGNVGIGASPATGAKLHLSSTAGAPIYIEDSDATSTFNITEFSNNGANFSLQTRNSSGTYVSTDYQIVKDANGANYHRWFTFGSERMRIDVSGNIMMGTTNAIPGAGNTIAGVSVYNDGRIFASKSGNTTMSLNRNTSDGGIVEFRKDGSTVGSIQTNSGRLDIQGASNTVRVQSGTSLMQVTNGTQISFETAGSERMRIDSSGNVGIGDTTPDEKLSVYGAVTSSYQAANFSAGPYRANMDIIYASKKVRLGSIQGSNTPTGNEGEVGIYVNSGEKVTIDVNGNVGIGTTSPAFKLHVVGNSYFNGDVDIVSSSPSLLFSVPGGGLDSRIHNDGSGNFIFGTGANSATPTERMRIDSSGNLLVGTTDLTLYDETNGGETGFALRPDGRLYNSTQGNTSAIFNRIGTGGTESGTILQFRSNGTTVGSIGVNTGDKIYIGTGASGVGFSTLGLLPFNTSTNAFSNGSLDLGNGSFRWKDLYLSGTANLNFIHHSETLYPTTDAAVDIGTSSERYRNFYLSGAVKGGNGSASAPTFSFGNTTTMGMYRGANHQLAFSTNSTERMRIDGSGNLLVGKTSSSITTAGTTITGSSLAQSVSDTSTNLATNGGAVLNLCNTSATDGNFSNIGGYNSNGLVVSQMNFINVSHTSRTGAITLSTHNGTSLNEAMRIDASGNVGIGTTSPSATFEVKGGNGNNFRLNNDGSTYTEMIFQSNGTSKANLQLVNNDFYIVASQAGSNLRFYTVNSERMRIDSSGNLLVGKTSAGFTVAGHEIKPGGFAGFTRDGGAPIVANRLTSDGNIIEFYKDTTTVGNIGVDYGDNLFISGNSTHVGLMFDSAHIWPYKNGNFVDATVDLGVSSGRFKDLHLSGAAYSGGQFSAGTTGNSVFFAEGSAHIFRRGSAGSYAEFGRFDTTGNLLVGTTDSSPWGNSAANANDNGVVATSGGIISSARYNNTPALFNRTGDNGTVVSVRKNGIEVGSIGVIHGNNLTVGSTTAGHIGIQFGTGIIYPTDNTGSANDGAVALGDTNQRFSNLFLSGTSHIGSNLTLLPSGSNSEIKNASGVLYYKSGQHNFQNAAGTTEYGRFDTSGHLLVGTTDTTLYNNTTGGGVMLSNSGCGFAKETSSAGDPVAYFNNTGADGQILDFRKDGTTKGAIGTDATQPDGTEYAGATLYIGAGDAGFGFTDNGDFIYPYDVDSNTPRDGTITLGHSSARFKDLYLSGGVYLGGTGSANKLDDYEEGTWTPSWQASTTTVTVNHASYVKIGKMVTVNFYITNISPATSGDAQYITGLPFAIGSGSHYPAGVIAYSDTTDVSNLAVIGLGGNSSIYFHYLDGTGSAALTRNNWNSIKSSGLTLIISMTYEAA